MANSNVTEYRLVGLNKSKPHATLNFLHTDKDIFWADIEMPKDRFDALFNWAKNEDNFWKRQNIAVVKHDGVYDDNTPINPIMIEFKQN